MSNNTEKALAPFIGKRIKNINWWLDWGGYQVFAIEMEDGQSLKVREVGQCGQAVLDIGDDRLEPIELDYHESEELLK